MEIMVDENIKVMEAYKRGAKVKYRKRGTTEWEFTNEPIWNFAEYEYAVDDTKVLDVTNIKQFFTEYRGDKVADANNVLDQILPVLTSNSYEHIIDWLHNNTQQLEASGFIKETAIDYDYMKESQPDLIQEILNTEEVDPENMTEDEVENCVRYWMNRAGYDDIIKMIKDEA